MTTTIGDFLYSVDPNIGYRKTSNKASHTHVAGPKWPSFIQKWKDFDIETLEQMGGGILKQALETPFNFEEFPKHVAFARDEYSMPDNEAALDGFLISSVQQTVSCALSQTQRILHDQNLLIHIPRPGISMDRGSHAARIESDDGEHTYLADWAACLPRKPAKPHHTLQPAMTPTILPGDTKLRWKVDFNMLNEALEFGKQIDFEKFGLDEVRATVPIRPSEDSDYLTDYYGIRQAIIQIYTYCYNARCRYGYIITETQLFVIRIRPFNRHPNDYGSEWAMLEALKSEGLLEYRTIGYNVNDRGKLSVNMALWWLHLLAAFDNEIRWQYPPLKEMTMDLKTTASAYRKRSMSEESEPLPFSQVYEDQYFDLRPLPEERKRKWPSIPDSAQKSKAGGLEPLPYRNLDEVLHAKPETGPEKAPLPPPSTMEKQAKPSTRGIATPRPRKVLGPKPTNEKVTRQAESVRQPRATKKPLVNLPPRPLRPARPPMHKPANYVDRADRVKTQQDESSTAKKSTDASSPSAKTQPISDLYQVSKPKVNAESRKKPPKQQTSANVEE